MGGIGSGRQGGSGRRRVEDIRSIDINRLQRDGCLRPGWTGALRWFRDDVPVAAISLSSGTETVHLSYRVGLPDGDREIIAQTVRIVRIPCHFGGARLCFLCPGSRSGRPCGRRVVRLHGAGRHFLCRICHGLAHASQSENPRDRAYRRARKLQRQLGREHGEEAHRGPKPKGMWRRTWERLADRAAEAEALADEAFTIEALRLLCRIEARNRKRSSRA